MLSPNDWINRGARGSSGWRWTNPKSMGSWSWFVSARFRVDNQRASGAAQRFIQADALRAAGLKVLGRENGNV